MLEKDGLKTKFELGAPLNEPEALLFWVEYLQERSKSKNSCPDNNPPMNLKLMARGMNGDEENYTEVNCRDDDPINVVDGTWTAFQLLRFPTESVADVHPTPFKLRIPLRAAVVEK
jgi:hypothetical protein